MPKFKGKVLNCFGPVHFKPNKIDSNTLALTSRSKFIHKTQHNSASKYQLKGLNWTMRVVAHINQHPSHGVPFRRRLVALLLGLVALLPLVLSDPTSAPVSTPRPTRRKRVRAPHGMRPNRPVPNPPLPGKKGVVYILREGADQLNLFRVMLLRVYWNFSWSLVRVLGQPSNIEFVPMQWGGTSVAKLESMLNTSVVPFIETGQVKRIFGFNEPDSVTQANISPDTAIALWPSLEKLGIPLCSPSCVNDLPTTSDDWLEVFMNKAAAKKYRVDYIGVHWYGSPSVTGFQSYMKSVYTRYNRPLIITEFAVADWSASATVPSRYSPAQVLSFMKIVVPWLESQSWIFGYSWYSFDTASPPGGSSAFFDTVGNLTTLGLFYQSVTTENPQGDQTIGVAPTVAPIAPTAKPVASSSPVTPTAQPIGSSSPAAPTAMPVASSSPVASTATPVASRSVVHPTNKPTVPSSPVALTTTPVVSRAQVTPTAKPVLSSSRATPTSKPVAITSSVAQTGKPVTPSSPVTPTATPHKVPSSPVAAR